MESIMYILDGNNDEHHYNIEQLQGQTLNTNKLCVAINNNRICRELCFLPQPIKKIILPSNAWGIYLGNRTQIESIEIPSLDTVQLIDNDYIRHIDVTNNGQFVEMLSVKNCPNLKTIPPNIGDHLICDNSRLIRASHLTQCQRITNIKC